MAPFKSAIFLAAGVAAPISCAFILGALPSTAMAQAAVSSDQPLARSNDAAGLNAIPSQSLGADAPGSRDVPNPQTGPGSPGTTGTGAAGTGPTGTMAAPGR